MDDAQLFKGIGWEKKIKDFQLLRFVGKGSFGKVFMCKEISTGEILAMKVLKKEMITSDIDYDAVLAENNVLRKIKHPFVTSLKYSFQTCQNICFVTELYNGGDLMFHIMKAKRFDEDRARFYGAEITLAIGYLHELKILLRSLKLDDVALDRDGHVKLIDLGLIKEGIGYGDTTSTFCGNPDYFPPEILEEKDYGHAVDWWTLGVTMYQMLCGQPPFEADNEDELFESIIHDEVLYPMWISSLADHLLRQLLIKNPSKRLGGGPNDYKDVIEHKFFESINFDDLLAKRIKPPFLPKVEDDADFSNFDADFTSEKPVITPPDSDNEGSSDDKNESEATNQGHILTVQELQVLRTLLAPYTDEKLKELQLLIQRKEEGEISREEVEKSLRQSGLTMVADRLKDDIEKGVENVKHYEAYEQALQDGISLTLRYLKFLFLGPPRSGKTSARRRLVQEIINLSSLGQPSKSTGVAETNDIIIKKLVCESTAIVNSMWQTLRHEGGSSGPQQQEDFTYLAQWFYRLISMTTSDGDKTTPHDTTSIATLTDTPSDSDPSVGTGTLKRRSHTTIRVKTQKRPRKLNNSEELEIQAALEKLTTILQSDSPVELQQLLEELTMINMVDVGGQPALMEMLPSLTIGPALYFLFFRLDQELGKSYQVRYHAIDKEMETTLESSYCIENILYQSLSSIACFGYSEEGDMSSGVLLFGTYKDRVDGNRISQISSILEDKLLKTKLYKEGLLLKTSKGELFFSLDNMNGDESEMSEVRFDVEEIVKKHFSATPIPAAWLMFRIVLHLLRKPVLSFAECRAIATKLSMPTSVEEALWFFHHNIGNLMYYSDIPSMQDTVICDPQVIFDSVSELIIDRFSHSNRSLSSHEVDDFHRKGLFSLSQINSKTEHQRSSNLKLTQLVDLLKDLNVIAEINRDEDELDISATNQSQPSAASKSQSQSTGQSRSPATDNSEPKFIMPAVLKFASQEELKTPAITDPSNRSISIMICFESGFVPFGVFCATTAHLIAHQDTLSPKWRLCDNQVMRNKITFSVDRAFFATIASRDQYLQIQISRHPRARKGKSLSFVCSTVRLTVINSLQTVISKMKFKPYIKMGTSFFSSGPLFYSAFECCIDDSHSNHLMKVVENLPGERYAECLEEGVEIDLEDEHMLWFDEEHETQCKGDSLKKQCKDDSLVRAPVTIPSQANAGSIVLKKPAEMITATTVQAADVKCPVCLNIQVDPCTLQCGHSVCQLCLGRLWNNDEKFCPVCKQTWREFPAISYNYRTNIESSYGDEVDELRKQYTQEDRELILTFCEARKLSLKSEKIEQRISITDSESFRRDLNGWNSEQLTVWLKHHPRLSGRDYQHDFGKLNEAKINGISFLTLDEGSLKIFGLSAEFQSLLMKIIEELKMYQVHKIETEEPDASQSTSLQPSAPYNAMQPLQSLPTAQPEEDVQLQHSKFSKDMNNEQLAVWLTNHPSLTGTDYDEDIRKLRDARINGHILLSLNESRLERFRVSLGFQFAIMSIIEDLTTHESEKQQHSQPPSVNTAITKQQAQPTSTSEPNTRKSARIGPEQPEALLANQPPTDVHQRPLIFSKDMNYEQLAVWLTDHPQFVGADYQQDIRKLKDSKINGYALLSLTESRLERFGVSFGFQVILMSIIEHMQSSQRAQESVLLPCPLQQQFLPGSVATPAYTVQSQHRLNSPPFEKQSKFDKLPTLDELLILKYKDKGEKRRVRIITDASHKWKNIANLICGDNVNVTNVLEQKCRGDPEECLKQTLIENFIRKKPRGYSQDWNGLIELLDDIDLETLAENVRRALSCI